MMSRLARPALAVLFALATLYSLGARQATPRPAAASTRAAERPAYPPPTTTTSTRPGAVAATGGSSGSWTCSCQSTASAGALVGDMSGA